MKRRKYKLSLLIILWLFLFLVSCTPGVHLFEPKIDKPLKIFENENNILFKVLDERKTNPNSIPGYENRNFQYTISIAEYVESYLNNSLKVNADYSSSDIVTVYIDQLRYDDYSSIKYSFRFSEPISKDTNFIFRISSKYRHDDVKVANPSFYLNYALTDCLERFFSNDEEFSGFYVSTSTNDEDLKSEVLFEENTQDTISSDTLMIKTEKLKETPVKEVQLGSTFVQKITLQSIGFSYLTGDKVTGGGHFYYSTGTLNEKSNIVFGYGIGLLFLDILNIRDGFDGFLLSFSAPLHITYHLSGYENGIFIGTTFKLTGGNETIDYGYQKEDHFFIGPVLEPFIGFKISNIVSFDAGGYFLALFGSKMLPDDYGARFNINFWF